MGVKKFLAKLIDKRNVQIEGIYPSDVKTRMEMTRVKLWVTNVQPVWLSLATGSQNENLDRASVVSHWHMYNHYRYLFIKIYITFSFVLFWYIFLLFELWSKNVFKLWLSTTTRLERNILLSMKYLSHFFVGTWSGKITKVFGGYIQAMIINKYLIHWLLLIT